MLLRERSGFGTGQDYKLQRKWRDVNRFIGIAYDSSIPGRCGSISICDQFYAIYEILRAVNRRGGDVEFCTRDSIYVWNRNLIRSAVAQIDEGQCYRALALRYLRIVSINNIIYVVFAADTYCPEFIL